MEKRKKEEPCCLSVLQAPFRALPFPIVIPVQAGIRNKIEV